MALPARRYVHAVFRDANHEFIRQVAPTKTVANLRWNAASTATLTVPDDHPIVALLMAEEGIRCEAVLVEDDNAGTVTTTRLVEGRVGAPSAPSSPRGSVQIPVADDWQDFSTMLGWQVPGAGASGQGAAEFAQYTGTSEQIAKAVIAVNAARLGRPWDVAPVTGLPGLSRTVDLRMDTLTDKILAGLIEDRVQLTIERNPDTGRWLVDVVQGNAFTRPLTARSGVLTSWSWVKEPPTATRAVVGGRGDGVEREFALVVDTALEAQLGVALEVFVNASSVDAGEDLAPYGWAELAKRRGKVALTAKLRESSWFRFPSTYGLGTRMKVHVGGLELEDVVTQISITHDTTGGLTVQPTVGLGTEDPQTRLVGIVGNVAAAVRGLEKR